MSMLVSKSVHTLGGEDGYADSGGSRRRNNKGRTAVHRDSTPDVTRISVLASRKEKVSYYCVHLIHVITSYCRLHLVWDLAQVCVQVVGNLHVIKDRLHLQPHPLVQLLF